MAKAKEQSEELVTFVLDSRGRYAGDTVERDGNGISTNGTPVTIPLSQAEGLGYPAKKAPAKAPAAKAAPAKE